MSRTALLSTHCSVGIRGAAAGITTLSVSAGTRAAPRPCGVQLFGSAQLVLTLPFHVRWIGEGTVPTAAPEIFDAPPTVPYVPTICTSPVSLTVTRPFVSTTALSGLSV